jgi:deazaflavin-dependent oxidoreductase (nitroreductase family)
LSPERRSRTRDARRRRLLPPQVIRARHRYATGALADRLARFNRALPNRVIRTFAGRLPPLAVVVHRGRRSGRAYRTPVVALPLPDGYLVALFYGADRDWVRNVLAAGSCTLERSWRRVELTAPRLLERGEALALAPAPLRAALRPLRVARFMRLQTR